MNPMFRGLTLALLAAGCQDPNKPSAGSPPASNPPAQTGMRGEIKGDMKGEVKPVMAKPAAPAASVKYFEAVEGDHYYVFASAASLQKFGDGDRSLPMTTREGLGMKGNKTVSFENGPDDLQDKLMTAWTANHKPGH